MYSSNWYDVMQVCLNGHQITDFADSQPESREKFCKDCGEKTITACPSCEMKIRGRLHMEGGLIFALSSTPVPQYCVSCGAAYPWQTAAIENLREILQESELSAEDRQTFEKALPDVLRDTPKTQSASLKARGILKKVGKPLYDVAIIVIVSPLP